MEPRISVVLAILLWVHVYEVATESWFLGCLEDSHHSSLDQWSVPVVLEVGQMHSVVNCAKFCLAQGMASAAVQSTEKARCMCHNGTLSVTNSHCCSVHADQILPSSLSNRCWSLYDSEGPYLTTVTIETDYDVAIVNKSIALEIFAARAAALNITEDDVTSGHIFTVDWKVSDTDMTFRDVLDLQKYTEIYHRPRYVFQDVGTYTVDVTIDNKISRMSATYTVEVVYPEPRDLQVRLSTDPNYSDLPSCIPPEVMATEPANQELAVFVNTTSYLEASVSMGTDVTFTFWFEDTMETWSQLQQKEDNDNIVGHVFAKTGSYLLQVTAANMYGTISKNITVMVIERQLSDLWIGVNPSSSPIVATGDPVSYRVSMVTTSRSNISLQVWYGDGRNNIVSIEDTNAPALVLKGDGKNMDIVASYGDGCNLIVEFEYRYNTDGTYTARAALLASLEEDDTEAVVQENSIEEENQIIAGPMEHFFNLDNGINDNSVKSGSAIDRHDMFIGLESLTVNSRDVLLESETESEVLVVSILSGVLIQSNTFGSCEYHVEFDLLSAPLHNLTVKWLIYKFIDPDMDAETAYDDDGGVEDTGLVSDDGDNDKFKLILDVNLAKPKLYHSFPMTGFYKIKAIAWNALSQSESVTTIMIQCPIEGLQAVCSHRSVQTGSEVKCESYVQSGSSVVFTWFIQDETAMNVFRYVRYSNFSSSIIHRFNAGGKYIIQVEARNNISAEFVEMELEVIDPIEKITILRGSHTALGDNTTFIAIHYIAKFYEFCDFKFDYGDLGIHKGFTAKYRYKDERMDDKMCYVRTFFRFPAAGQYTVTVYGYNNVSEAQEEFQVWVHSRLEHLTVEVVGQATVGSPTRFKVMENGTIVSTKYVYFEWLFGTGSQIYRTNAPLAETVFEQTGVHIVQLRIVNPAEMREMNISVNVIDGSKVNLHLLHDLYVAAGDDVVFQIKGAPINWSGIRVSYSEGRGVSMDYDGPISSWEYVFDMPGPQLVTVKLVNRRGTILTVLSSYVMVERPIRQVEVRGPSALAYDSYEYHEWYADLFSGTSVLYNWTLLDPESQESHLMTMPMFQEHQFGVGLYELGVEAFNDLSTSPVTDVKSFIIEHPIQSVQIKIFGHYVGQETTIQVNVNAFYELYTNICFGDGHNISVSTLDDPDKYVSGGEDEHAVIFRHVYEDAGAYLIIVNVSNSISYMNVSELFVPIVNISLTTRTPWFIPSNVPAIAKATVIGGLDLEYAWDFADEFGQTVTESYGNETIVAEHLFQLYGEYQVTFAVSGPHYPPPGLKVTLPNNFTVVSTIDEVKLIVEENAASIFRNETHPVLFKAMSSGSHVMFVFDYGDGTEEQCEGKLLPMQHVFTMTCDGIHVYTEEGEYKVSVMAVNALGNLTKRLDQIFYVQKPPQDLHFCDGVRGYYATAVGESLTLCAKVTSGTNVTFDWKLGDQTDVIKAGHLVTHQYFTPATRTVYVTAKNKVKKLVRKVQVHVNYKIQGVQLIPESTVVAIGQGMKYTAVVHPNQTEVVHYYIWTIKTPSTAISRMRKGPKQFKTKLPYIHYRFQESGWAAMRVEARNFISSETSESVDINVQERIKQLQIVVKNNMDVLVNRPITLSYFMYEGSEVQLTWNFGDGSYVYNTTQKDVQHSYNRSGVYNVTLTAVNQVSSETVSSLLFILDRLYCQEPKVTILNKPGTTVLFSRGLTLEADILTDCNLTSVVKFDWSIDGHVTKEMMDKRVLVLPPRSLNLGKHVINLKVTMSGTIVFSTDKTSIEVVHSNLSSQIKGGMFQKVPEDSLIILDGSGSFDPDQPAIQNFSFSWSCHFGSYYGNKCFLEPKPRGLTCDTDLNKAIVVLDPKCLVKADNYTFELTLHQEGRENTSAIHRIQVVQEKSPLLNLKIVRPFSLLDPVNPDRKVSFYVDCSNCPPHGVAYEWTLKHLVDTSIYSLSRAHDRPCVEPDGASYLSIIAKKQESEAAEARLVPSIGPSTAAPVLDPGEGNQGKQDYDWSDQVQEEEDFTDYDTDNFTAGFDMSTIPPMYQLLEGEVGYNRRRRSPPQDFEVTTETTTKFDLSVMEKTEGMSSRHRTIYDMDSLPFDDNMKEGSPGESGSSGGRGLFTEVVEGTSTGRFENSQVKQDTDIGSGTDSQTADRLEQPRKNPGRKLTILDRTLIPVPLRALQTRTGLNSSSLVLRPRVLQQGLTYVLQVKATYQGQDERLEGYTMSTFRVNESPNSGDCTVTPHSGVALETDFTFFCKEWKDEHLPLMYEVGYNIDESSGRNLIYRGVNRRFTFRLPAGRTQTHYNVYLYIDILDALLAKTSVCSIKIKVLPKTFSNSHNNSSSSGSSNITTVSPTSKQAPKQPLSDAQLIYDEISALGSYFQLSLDEGNDAVTKVYISYLATWLNQFHDNTQQQQTTNHSAAYSIDNVPSGQEAASDIDKIINGNTTGYSDGVSVGEKNDGLAVQKKINGDRERDGRLMTKVRKELLEYLNNLPIRDEAELLQTAQALAFITSVPEQLSVKAIDTSLKILKRVVSVAKRIYSDGITPTGNLVPLAVQSASSIIKATTDLAQEESATSLVPTFKQIVEHSVAAVETVILMELQYHVISEYPISSSTGFFSVLAQRQASDGDHSLQIGNARFDFTRSLDLSLVDRKDALYSRRPGCLQSHMTTFQENPFSFGSGSQIDSVVTGLNLYDCQGEPIQVENLPADHRIQVQLPNLPPEEPGSTLLTLRRWDMNVHQFNISGISLQQALHLVVELVPVSQGRLFPITLLISHRSAPSPSNFLFQYHYDVSQNHLDIFLPTGSFNDTGMYYIGLVDKNYNAGRHRPGEVTERKYRLQLWWGECLFWHNARDTWLPDGCTISRDSTFNVTRCECSHLTAFGGRFELVPNDLRLVDIEGFFDPQRNPVSISFICVLLLLYLLLFIWSHLADHHDAKKGGIVYLLDNAPIDQQKYEITLVTGFCKEAGTTAKISLILHGEEGMSETRELISDDDRPLFERNSRDKFILSLPDSIGRIWKVQIWHNNHGPSPSWFLSRVIVRDLNTGSQYFFLCEKWLAVEEQDGKVEREFMALDGPLDFSKAFVSRSVEYVADFHLWISLVTCPPYSGFMRTERLTVCLTTLLMYMCLNAVWYKTTVTEYRGEFGLLDLSWRNLTVGAICCAVVMPVSLFLEFLFRRSKPKNASSCQTKDEVTDWDHEYVSGKPNEQESEDTSEHVPPVMTYSLLDQSFLNWPNIQTWAQKQWLKRQQSVRSNPDSNSGTSVQSTHSATTALTGQPSTNMAEATLGRLGFSETDQASSGFEDCNSLIRPKASVDSMHTTAAPSISESMHVHKPQSLRDSLRVSKPASDPSSSSNPSNPPSISSSGSNFHKSSVTMERKEALKRHLYLPWWCRYISWGLCALLCLGSATVTIMYGYRFGVTKSTMWLQSLYFSAMICVFIANPFLILIAVLFSAVNYKNDPTSFESYSYDLFNREKAKEDLRRWKKQIESWDEGEALERGVAARQRSRYLRFARPPQEKQLIEARKRVMKEKKALSIFRESVAFVLSFILLLIIAYGKDTRAGYHLNLALRNQFTSSGSPLNFTSISSQLDWYQWAQTSLFDSLDTIQKLHNKAKKDASGSDTYIIGEPQIRLQRIALETCPSQVPGLVPSCLGSSQTQEAGLFGYVLGLSYTRGHQGSFVFGKHGVYDGSGFILSLSLNRSEAKVQIAELQHYQFLDRQTRVVFVEFTLYNTPTNLFTAVQLLLEMSPTGGVSPVVKVTSTQLFRYVTSWDNVVLACELLFFVLMMMTLKGQLVRLLKLKTRYFTYPWNVLNFILCVLSMGFCMCYVYRFVIVSSTIETLRSSYYEKYIDLTFITSWDEMLRCGMACLLFLSTVKCLRLLRYNKQFAIFGDVYRKARREVIIFFAMFMVLLAAYTSLGHALFGSVRLTFRDLWSSLLGVTTLLTGCNHYPEFQSPRTNMAANVFLFSFVVFSAGFLTAYMVAVLTHYFRVRKKRRLLAMGGLEAILFYWEQFQLWTGLKRVVEEEEPVIILPPEFTMAEIEYQVDELLFRMNALTGSHGLPEKPPCYLTDSDCTYGGGDDGISSGGSEPGLMGIEDRLEQRVQKIEDNLYSQEPFLAQLLKLDSIGMDDFSHEKEKQLRSHLELEIFRQLQIQRQDQKAPSGGGQEEDKGDNSNNSTAEYQQLLEEKLLAPKSPGNDSTSSDETNNKQKSSNSQPEKPVSKPKRTKANLTVQAIQDILGKTSQEPRPPPTDNSSPDSPKDKPSSTRVAKQRDNSFRQKYKPNNSSTSSSEKISYDTPVGHFLADADNIKMPTKPTFLHSRESSLSDGPRGSPSLKLRTALPEKGGSRSESVGVFESSSGSEQDGIHLCRKLLGKRSLRKTKSRGKGKCSDGLEAALVLDEIEWEEGHCFGNDVIVESLQGETIAESFHKEMMAEIEQREITSNMFPSKDKGDKNDQVVQADVHCRGDV